MAGRDYFTTLAKTDEHGFCMFLVERENDLQADFALDTRPIKVSYSAAAGTAYVSASSSLPSLHNKPRSWLASECMRFV